MTDRSAALVRAWGVAVAVAATRPRYRRPALVSAGLATMSAGTGTLALLRHQR